MLKFLNIIPIHFEQNLAHSKSIDVALIVRAGEICFGQNLAHSKSVDAVFLYMQGKFVLDKTWHIIRLKLKRSSATGN